MSYEDFKIKPDEALLSQYEAHTYWTSIHERNRCKTNYMWGCRAGEIKVAERFEKLMRQLIVQKGPV